MAKFVFLIRTVTPPNWPSMNRSPVESSDIASIGYDPATHTLEIEFQTGALYEYQGVPADTHAQLMSAPSHGRYFNQHVKKGGFVCVRLR